MFIANTLCCHHQVKGKICNVLGSEPPIMHPNRDTVGQLTSATFGLGHKAIPQNFLARIVTVLQYNSSLNYFHFSLAESFFKLFSVINYIIL